MRLKRNVTQKYATNKKIPGFFNKNVQKSRGNTLTGLCFIGRDAAYRKVCGVLVVRFVQLPTTFQMWSFFIYNHRSFFMSIKKTSRPTRDEAIEAIFESCINIKRSTQKLEDILRREADYIRKKHLRAQ